MSDERVAVLSRSELTRQCGIPMRVNEMEDAALPDRRYPVGKDQRIAYAGQRGPIGFKPAELGAAIDRELAEA